MAREMKIGDKVLCIGGSSKHLKIGSEYIIDGFACCPNCGRKLLLLSGLTKIVLSLCGGSKPGCGNREVKRQCYSQGNFILPDLESLHAHRVNVSAKELTEIKTHQLS